MEVVADVALQGSQKGRLVITVRGRLDESTGRTLRSAIQARLENADDLKEIVFDLRDLEDYDILGRAELIAAHRLLTARDRRTVYVSTRPRIRGARRAEQRVDPARVERTLVLGLGARAARQREQRAYEPESGARTVRHLGPLSIASHRCGYPPGSRAE